METIDLVNVAISVAAQKWPAVAVYLGAVPVIQGLAAFLARVTKRSHPTQLNTWATKIAAFPIRVPGTVTK